MAEAGLDQSNRPVDGERGAAVDKWSLLQDLISGRAVFGLSDRNLTVLSALLSFYPARDLRNGAPIVFPSNASLSDRLHGMPESTLRRHLAALIEAGMIVRHDSPNGKRYATRGRHGQIDRVFGFDLRPLLHRADEIATAADQARETQRLIRRTRQTIALLMRELLIAHGSSTAQPAGAADQYDDLRRLLRRKLSLAALTQIETRLRCLRADALPPVETAPEMSVNDSQNERHQQNTNSDHYESEESCEYTELPPLDVVLKAAPDIGLYAQEPLRDWSDLTRVANFVRPMLGITAETWASARESLGRGKAAIVLSCILQKFGSIRNPGAYLRRLTQTENFRIGPMVMALLRSNNNPNLCS